MLGNWNDVHRRENDLNKAWGFTRRANVKINKPDIDAESSQKHNVEWEKASSRRTKPQRRRLKNWTLNTSKEGQCMQVGIRSRTPVTFSFFSWVVGACLFCDVIIYPISYPWKWNNKTKEEIELVDDSYGDGPWGWPERRYSQQLVTHPFTRQVDLMLFFI